ncbi:hypothetical protein PROFUN_00629 [Planoprotostelium fungivorum]|uniref:PUM-HD domain-containing protein n=2 Tax=Planoprotostelium fungivorum TaxID=1890364 RepID=A0A2P6NU73_9EUKA|nr:hypothetical protein PROFUN_00629 [Planoprotostelium fungivorum]
MDSTSTLPPTINQDDTREILFGKLETALKLLEDKDRQVEHYKQLVKTLKDVLADVHSKGSHSHSHSSHANSHAAQTSGSPPKNAPITASTSGQNSSFGKTVGGNKSATPQPIAPNNNNGRQIGRRNSIGSRTQSNDASRHEWPVSSAQNLSFLSDDDETDTTSNASASTVYGFNSATNPAPTKDQDAQKRDVDKIGSWRRAGDTTNAATGPDGRPSRTTTVTQPKTVTINSNPIMNSPRGLKKSVSHHALSAYSSGQQSMDSRPLAPLGRGNAPGFTKRTNESVSAKSNDDDKASNNKLKKSQSMTSVYSVLEENRLDLKFPELDQMVGQIYALSKYQQGCRFLQKKLDENNPSHTNIILNELMDHLMELMTDPFGNYLFSKLMEHCSVQQREQIIRKIINDLLPTAFDMYGTQSMQKMMPYLTEPQIDMVVNALKPSSIALIKHNKANYLIQYCLDHLPQKHNQWIYDAVCECMDDVGRDRVGCVIVKRCVDHATDNQMAELFRQISNTVLSLVQDPFGNYVVQHILEKHPVSDRSQVLISRLLGSITELCVQKFSSNVVEKCLKMSNADNKHAFLVELTQSEMLSQLLGDRFANFVIQTALDVAEPEDRQELVKAILPHLGRQYSPYTKRLQKKILQV